MSAGGVLVANRGEIARRVIRACNEMGLRTVAIYTLTDALAPHVREATVAVYLGEKTRAYTDAKLLLSIAKEQGVQAVHPGYGFLSENEEFCNNITQAGIAWLGPTAETMHQFSLKHVARECAEKAQVPVLPGSPVLSSVEQAVATAHEITFPVLLKATGGGGGMGIFECNNEEEVRSNFEVAQRTGKAYFGNSGVFMEKYIRCAHHVEVQIFGDGEGGCIHLGERECSIQRRHQKILEETPSPLISEELRGKMTAAAVALGVSTKYRSAGTVEFLVDEDSGRFYFLEVNTRLQVEHGITELVRGVDIVKAQLELQVPKLSSLSPSELLAKLGSSKSQGWSIEVRLNGEDPARNFEPSPGLIGNVTFPETHNDGVSAVRVDSWIESGTEVSPHYDSLLGKMMVHAPSRDEAIAKMSKALDSTFIEGIPSNLEFLKVLVKDPRFKAGNTTTRFLEGFHFEPRMMQVVSPGLQTSVQDWPGRVKLWHVGVPPSGPMDILAHRLANALVGNDAEKAALEFSLVGPTLKFLSPCLISLTGARFSAHLDGEPVSEWWSSFHVKAGQTLTLGQVEASTGVRGYLGVRGGIDVPLYLGSRSTFPGGKFGGHQGRNLLTHDSLPIGAEPSGPPASPTQLPSSFLPSKGALNPDGSATWEVGVLPGPHADPDFLTAAYMDEAFYKLPFKVHYNSNRLGVRLIGQEKPAWVRTDGGEGGSHPSNVHDHIYAIGAVNFTGDHPVVLTVDGPSLGGFVCPSTIISSELWKMGQVRPNDLIQFKRLTLEEAYSKLAYLDAMESAVRSLALGSTTSIRELVGGVEAAAQSASEVPPELQLPSRPILKTVPASKTHPGAEYRLAGDRYVQVEYGPMELDLTLRVRVHYLENWLKAQGIEGIVETSPGVRSLMIEYDLRKLPLAKLLAALDRAEEELPDVTNAVLPSRILHLPMAFEDSKSLEAIQKYMRIICPDAPYLPSNIEYMAANNGLTGDNVKEVVASTIFSASYIVLGLGDVYLGAPCAVPLDPRHRLVTTKYNPARTFTAEGTVGIGGSYMCVYPMDSPGGYQLVGRTLPIWNTFGRSKPFSSDHPWLLEFFDQVKFFRVSEAELDDAREKFATGRYEIKIESVSFDLSAYNKFVASIAPEVTALKLQQRAAMEIQLSLEEKSLARLAAEEGAKPQNSASNDDAEENFDARPDLVKVTAPFSASVWEIKVKAGDTVTKGQTVIVLEAMKMESPVLAPCEGSVVAVLAVAGKLVPAGSLLIVFSPA